MTFPEDRPGASMLARHGNGAAPDRVLDKLHAIQFFSAQREEKRAGRNFPAVVGDERISAIRRPADLPDLGSSQSSLRSFMPRFSVSALAVLQLQLRGWLATTELNSRSPRS